MLAQNVIINLSKEQNFIVEFKKQMINLKAVSYVIGILISTLGLAMLLPAFFELANDGKEAKTFLYIGTMCLITGGALTLAFKSNLMEITNRDTIILSTLSWIILCFFAALPIWASGNSLSFVDSFFEATSGLTTTGATILTNLESKSEGILVWRALLQWLGGLGIIVIAIAILPILNIGGMQLFSNEWNEKPDNLKRRATELAKLLGIIYLSLTLLCALMLWFVGLSKFDALCHSMTTIATGGFSTHDKSIGYFNNSKVEIIIIIGMLISSLPFVLFLDSYRKKKNLIFNDSQVKTFLFITLFFILTLTFWLYYSQNIKFTSALRMSAFNGISIITGTGYASADFSKWGSFAITIMFFMMLIGGCTGSTTGGLKIFRIQILFLLISKEIKKAYSPRSVANVNYAGKTIEENTITSIMILITIFLLTILLVAISLSLSGYDLLTSLSAGASAVSIVGPGLGPILGPAENFSLLPDHSKITLAFAMILGRLEFLTVIVIFTPKFWLN